MTNIFYQNHDVDFSFNSGAVEFASMMSVDAYFTKSGIKMTSTLHSSTGVSTKIEIKNKQEYVFNFDVPKTKSEIVTAR